MESSTQLPIHFAPLQGYTEAIYRKLHATCFGHIESYYTPFMRVQEGTVRNKDKKELDPDLNGCAVVIPQLMASRPEEARILVDSIVEAGYKQIDINLGCPFPLIVRRKKGAGILPFPQQVEKLMQVVTEYPDISFSVKMRLGQENIEESLRLLPFLNELPLHHITMHPRLGIQQYKGETDMRAFRQFYEACSTPLIYNGDLHTIEEINTIVGEFPELSGIMIGRGLLANPALALEYQEGVKLSPSALSNRLQEMHQELFNWYHSVLCGETQILLKIKSFWEYLLPQAEKRLRKKILKSTCVSGYLSATQRFFEEFPSQG